VELKHKINDDFLNGIEENRILMETLNKFSRTHWDMMTNHIT